MAENPTLHPDPEALAQLRQLVLKHGGSYLPEPSCERHCDDCGQWALSFTYGVLDLCARHWLQRDRVARRLTEAASHEPLR
jgi:hypothetical protein